MGGTCRQVLCGFPLVSAPPFNGRAPRGCAHISPLGRVREVEGAWGGGNLRGAQIKPPRGAPECDWKPQPQQNYLLSTISNARRTVRISDNCGAAMEYLRNGGVLRHAPRLCGNIRRDSFANASWAFAQRKQERKSLFYFRNIEI